MGAKERPTPAKGQRYERLDSGNGPCVVTAVDGDMCKIRYDRSGNEYSIEVANLLERTFLGYAPGHTHGLVAENTCTCVACNPAQTGSARTAAPTPWDGKGDTVKPCPFCGSTEDLSPRSRPDVGGELTHWVECDNCGASGPTGPEGGWNRRGVAPFCNDCDHSDGAPPSDIGMPAFDPGLCRLPARTSRPLPVSPRSFSWRDAVSATPMREVLRAAANELVNCEATSDANADEQLRLATALRTLAARLDAEMRDMTRHPGDARHRSVLEVLARLDAPVDASPMETK